MFEGCVIFPGYLLGFRYPIISLRVLNLKPDPARVKALSSALAKLGPDVPSLLNSQTSTPELLKVIAEQSLLSMDAGIMEKPRVLASNAEESQLVVPCHRITAAQLIHILTHCNWLLSSDTVIVEHQKILRNFH